MIKFIASFKYGQPHLSKIEVNRETDKTCWIAKEDKILGYIYCPKMIRKDRYTFFDNAAEAIVFLITKSEEYSNRFKGELGKQLGIHSQLVDLLREIKQQEKE